MHSRLCHEPAVKNLFVLLSLAAFSVTGCQNTSQRVDRFDNVRIQQMEANNVTRAWFEKVVVCLKIGRAHV